jgi:hypothetical protein
MIHCSVQVKVRPRRLETSWASSWAQSPGAVGRGLRVTVSPGPDRENVLVAEPADQVGMAHDRRRVF